MANQKPGIFEREAEYIDNAKRAETEYRQRGTEALLQLIWEYHRSLDTLRQIDQDTPESLQIMEYHIVPIIFKIISLFNGEFPCDESSPLIKHLAKQPSPIDTQQSKRFIEQIAHFEKQYLAPWYRTEDPVHHPKSSASSLDILFIPPCFLQNDQDAIIMSRFGPLILREAILTNGFNTLQDVTLLSTEALLRLQVKHVDPAEEIILPLIPRVRKLFARFNVYFTKEESIDIKDRARDFVYNVNFELLYREAIISRIKNAQDTLILFRNYVEHNVDQNANLYENFHKITGLDLTDIFGKLLIRYRGHQCNWRLLPLISELLAFDNDHLMYLLSEMRDDCLLQIKKIIDRILDERNNVNFEAIQTFAMDGSISKIPLTQKALASLVSAINQTLDLRIKYLQSAVENMKLHAAKALRIFDAATVQRKSSFPWLSFVSDMSGFPAFHEHLLAVKRTLSLSHFIIDNPILMLCEYANDVDSQDTDRFGKPLYSLNTRQKVQIKRIINQIHSVLRDIGTSLARTLARPSFLFPINIQILSKQEVYALNAFFETAHHAKALIHNREPIGIKIPKNVHNALAISLYHFSRAIQGEMARRNLIGQSPKIRKKFPLGDRQARRKTTAATHERLASVVSASIQRPSQRKAIVPKEEKEK